MSDVSKDYGEPWIASTESLRIIKDAENRMTASTCGIDGSGFFPSDKQAEERRDRIIACVNAMAGIDDPAAELARRRHCNGVGCDYLNHVKHTVKQFEKVLGDDAHGLPVEMVAKKIVAELSRLRREHYGLRVLLAEWTNWKPDIGIIPPEKPGHGPCCTCQKCGRNHDDCVCQHNEIETAIAALGEPKA